MIKYNMYERIDYMNILKKLFDHEYKELEKFKKIADQIMEEEPVIEKLTDEELKGKTKEFQDRLKNGETLEDIKVEAFAVAREAARIELEKEKQELLRIYKKIEVMEEFNYAEAIAELEKIAAEVENPSTGIDDIDKYIRRSDELVAKCRAYLRAARSNIDHIS